MGRDEEHFVGKLNTGTLIGNSDATLMTGTSDIASRVVTSDTLFAGRRELLITHSGEAYRLRLTNQGKLILTK